MRSTLRVMPPVRFAITGISLITIIVLADVSRHESHADTTKSRPLPRIDQTQVVGSSRCAECHKAHYERWKDSAHNKMIRAPIATGPNKTIVADFSKPDPIRPFELKDVKW